MIIYIPKHLKKLEIVLMFSKLIEEYGKRDKTDDAQDVSFDKYYYYYAQDPVDKFLRMLLKNVDDATINYLSELFYSVKGSVKVIEYIRTYLGIEWEKEPLFTQEVIRLEITDVNIEYSINIWLDALKDFLDALLYYRELRAYIREVNMTLSETLRDHIDYDIKYYKKFEVL